MADLKEDNDRALRVMQEQHLFEQDKQAFSDNITAMKKWDRLYNGTKDILNQNRELPMSQRFDEASVSATDQARQVVNIIFQLVESQIDISVPKPRVDAQEEAEAGAKAKMVEGYLEYLSRGPELERINTENERIVKKNSLAYLKLTYDPNYHSHNFRGKIKITNPHPINIIPQKGIAKISQMDRIWHVENMSISRIARLYQDYYDGGYDALLSDLQDSSDTHADLKNMETISDIGHSDETRALIEKWYIDEEGDVGLLTYVDMIFLRDVPKYFYPRNSETGEIEYTEEIMLTEVNEIGEVVEQVVEVPIKAPKRLPIIAWYNVPKELSFLGKSDVEVIIDQQESIKKLLSIEEEKQVKGTQKIITRKGANLKSKITDATTQVLETDDPVSDVKVIDMKTHDPDLRNMYDLLDRKSVV